MKKQILVGLLTLAMGVAAHAVTIGYSDTGNGTMVFNGSGGFGFLPTSDNLKVTTGTANNDLGEITGSYQIGTITTIGSVSSASVTGTGTFVIHDGTGHDFSATLTWANITQQNTGGNLNITGGANLSNITYTGSNADLLALTGGNNLGINVLAFTFIPAVSLQDLATTPHTALSFSGTVSKAPDGGTTVALLGSALVGLSVLRRKFGVIAK